MAQETHWYQELITGGKMSNKKNGNIAEYLVGNYLYNTGWWVHLMQQRAEGQPADIIACKGNKTILVDVKDCQNDEFSLDRVEYNQINCMARFKERTDFECYFAFVIRNEIIFVKYIEIIMAQHLRSTVDREWLKIKGVYL